MQSIYRHKISDEFDNELYPHSNSRVSDPERLKIAVFNLVQNQNRNSLLVIHQLTYIHQGQRMRGLVSRSHL